MRSPQRSRATRRPAVARRRPMIAADRPIQRPADCPAARRRSRRHASATAAAPEFVRLLRPGRPGDCERCRDAARQPGRARMCRPDAPIEVRLAGRRLARSRSTALFGGRCSAPAISGRAPKIGRRRPAVHPETSWSLGPLAATIVGLHDHPRLVALRFDGAPDDDLGGPRPARPADPVRAPPDAARAVGHMDRRSPARRSRSSRRRPGSCSTGARSRP